jgi:3-dehydroquinate synthase
MADVARVEAIVSAHSLPTRLRAPHGLSQLQAAMGRDKKVRAGEARFIVLESLGTAATRSGVDPALVEACWREVGAA